ncbi:MAG TPA: hypothetical protein VEO01_05845 [Pseudonocardiaceae bacterium]|nr:hypothetical protein [Pseudonocardiaceae bacterium]
MHIRSLIKLGVVAAASAGCLAIVAPTATAAPDISNFIAYQGDHETGSFSLFECDRGFDYAVLAVSLPFKSARNNCEFRVHLQYSGGRSICINPHSTRNGILPMNQRPIGVKIGPSTANC